MDKEKTFQGGVNATTRETILDIIEQYKEKPSDLKFEVNKALDKMDKGKTFQDGINAARKAILDIIEQYKEKPSDDLQKDLKFEVNKALDKILEEC